MHIFFKNQYNFDKHHIQSNFSKHHIGKFDMLYRESRFKIRHIEVSEY